MKLGYRDINYLYFFVSVLTNHLTLAKIRLQVQILIAKIVLMNRVKIK